MSKPTPSCETCRFSAPQFGHQTVWLVCRRRAPVLPSDATKRDAVVTGAAGCWPRVGPSDWCGEYDVTSEPSPPHGGVRV